MTLLALMYHRARAGPLGNAPEMIDAHFAHIAANFACVLPGERLASNRLSVCLTFDDAYFDFYAVVFPLLEKHGLKALLAVPLSVVRERVEAPTDVRLRDETDVRDAKAESVGFCTWAELRELAGSGLVTVAAHGFTHRRLDSADADLHTEVVVPQSVLSARLDHLVKSFVFPFGRFDRTSLELVRQHYGHTFRIGNADNYGWNGSPLYRVSADEMEAPDAPFRTARRARYRARHYWNRLRGR